MEAFELYKKIETKESPEFKPTKVWVCGTQHEQNEWK